MVARSYDQRHTSDRSSAYAALISNISERDRASDVEQFDDILRNFINETNKYEGRFWENSRRREDLGSKKKKVLESLLNCRFRGTTLPYKVTTHSASKVKKLDMAAGTDVEEAFEEGLQKNI